MVGGVGNGWGTALTVLMYERLTIGLGSEGFGYNADRFAAAMAADAAARQGHGRAPARSARSRPTCWRCASPATGR